jgi:2',3'-cyclic-nucleotide 2'-phosphodiesterase (5'-nucleotidase family)
MSHLCALLAAGVAVATTSACVDFNECVVPDEEPLGRAGLDLDLRESVVRTQESSIGNLVADGLFRVADTLCTSSGFACPDVALQNAGGLRQETACGRRDSIDTGPIYEQDVVDLMPFDNELVVITLPGSALKRALERSVSSLGQAGEGAQAGYFLQVSGVSFTVDCVQPAQTLLPNQLGIERVGGRVTDPRIISRGRDDPIVDDDEYEIVTNSFIGSGNDGFLAFLLLDDDLAVLEGADGEPTRRLNPDTDRVKTEDGDVVLDRDAVIDWIKAHDRSDPPLPVGRPPEGRITIAPNCYGGELSQ